jgi:SAM-dependent methyltransferase
MKAFRDKKDSCPDLNLVLRHDIDFDIHTARRMLEIEHEYGLTSAIYPHLRCPSYSLDDIIALYDDFAPKGFHFGIHVNTAYEAENADHAWDLYVMDLGRLAERGYMAGSCVGHIYDARSDETEGYPDSFVRTFFGNKPYVYYKKLGDGGGSLRCGPIAWVNDLGDDGDAYFSAHPTHYDVNGSDVLFTKKYVHPRPLPATAAHKSIHGEITSYLQKPLEQHWQQLVVASLLNQVATRHFAEKFTIVDVGCGVGLLGTALIDLNNVRYIGVDLVPEYVEAGKKMFELMGYAPTLICQDLYGVDPLPDGDIFVLMAYEDDPVYWDLLPGVIEKYENVFITTMKPEADEDEFIGLFAPHHKRISRYEGQARFIHWLVKV